MTLYSDRAKLDIAARRASDFLAEQLGS
jgi:hypothetical protein